MPKNSGSKCPKCGGLMAYEQFSDSSGEKFYGWRCIPCGVILDALILKNRSMAPSEINRRETKVPRKLKKKRKNT